MIRKKTTNFKLNSMVNNKLHEKTGKCVMLVDDLKIFYLFSFTAYSAQVGGGPHSCHGARGMVHLTQRQLHTYGHTERSQPAARLKPRIPLPWDNSGKCTTESHLTAN